MQLSLKKNMQKTTELHNYQIQIRVHAKIREEHKTQA